MLHVCPNCREGVGWLRVLRTPAWGTFRCAACGSVLGVSLPRRLGAIAIWIVVFLFLMEVLGFHTWGRLSTYSFMVASLLLAMYVGDRAVLVERRAFTCTRCGYSLKGLPEPKCPECGTLFDPAEREGVLARAGAPIPRRGYWWVGWCAAVLALAGVIAGFVVWFRTGSVPTGGAWVALVVAAVAIVMLFMVVAMLRRRSKAPKH